MRHYLISAFILLLILSFGSLKAQGYLPTVKEGTTWIVEWDAHRMGAEWIDTLTYRMQGDTSINGVHYFKVMQVYDSGSLAFRKVIREDTIQKKIYSISNTTEPQEYVAIDFDLEVGDPVYPNSNMIIAEIDTVFLYGKMRRRLRIHPVEWPYTSATSYLIEGIGSALYGPVGVDGPGVPNRLLNFFEGSTTPATEPEAGITITAFPNPGSGTVHFRTQNKENPADYAYQVYNTQGGFLQQGNFSFSNGAHSIDIGQTPGLYLIRLVNKTTGGQLSYKIIVH